MSNWRKSSRCEGIGNCVAVLIGAAAVGVRSTQAPEDMLAFPAADWRALVADLRDGRLERG